ncbi:MAG TPA: carboxylating nicotinate-nucleotide diphosphorylase [Bacteroidia bacterium]|nr:carboxylating nicotinate-nucleotide diphosphorylase [Bacteroidia bacterium]
MPKDYLSEHHKHFDLKHFVKIALEEDEGHGDVTSLATIPAGKTGSMVLLVKEEGVLAGVEAAKAILKHIDPRIQFKGMLKDGLLVKPGDKAFQIEGNVRKLLLAERLLLNVMQRMSGIATHTHKLQGLCAGTHTKVIDTRKTTPGFRFFEKWAVVIGGGANHRFGLYDMILIKDNHVDFCGNLEKAIQASKDYLRKHKLKIPIEVETRSPDDVKRVLACGGVQRVMFDNFSPAQTRKAVQLVNGKMETESSGGINEKNIAAYAQSGVDFISVGALTHHVKSLDMSLKFSV